MLHAQDTPVSLMVDMLEDILIIHFPCGWFIAAGIITDLEVSNLAVGQVHIVYDISFIALHVKHVEQYFAGWAVHGLANGIGLV